MTFRGKCVKLYSPLAEAFFVYRFKGPGTPLTLREVFNGFFPNFYQEVPIFMRVKITLACTECKQRNYDTEKNKKNDPDRLELNKYCRFCRKHTLHKETK